MADVEDNEKIARKTTSGTASRKSAKSGISRSTTRASTQEEALTRITSGRHLDDHPLYLGHSYHRDSTDEVFDEETSDDEAELTEKGSNETREPGSSRDVVPEVRDRIEDEIDLEAGLKLKKSKTTKSGKSSRDPNLVSWDGPEDPTNPKNWTFRK